MLPRADHSHRRNFAAVPWIQLLALLLMGSPAVSADDAMGPSPLVQLQTESATLNIGSNGALIAFSRRSDGLDYLAKNQPAPLLSLRSNGTLHAPDQATWDATAQRLTLRFAKPGLSAQIRVVSKPSHLSFELIEISPASSADWAVWGPYPTSIRKTVGEVVGVVRDDTFALGLQALNIKTLGGYPENDEGSADRPYGARQTDFGSVLQAYSMDRSRPRSIAVWNKRAPNMPVPAVPGETVLGSKIALFGCPEPQALETLGKIEVAEGLPRTILWPALERQSARNWSRVISKTFGITTFGVTIRRILGVLRLVLGGG
jgi:hypothetical protein